MTGLNKIRFAYRNLKEHKLRSFLTLLSIAVSIATIVSLVIISKSMVRFSEQIGRRLGANRPP